MVINNAKVLRRLTLSQHRTLKRVNNIPSVNVYLDTPSNVINMRDIFKGKRGVLFSVLGAFTPGCRNHIPEYLEHYEEFKSLGYDVIACVAVNDPFVMSAWAKSLNTKDKILMLADTKAEFAKAMKMDIDCQHIMGTIRSQRFSVVIEDNVIMRFNYEPDNTGLACLLCIKNMVKTPT